jgi:amino acid transporter
MSIRAGRSDKESVSSSDAAIGLCNRSPQPNLAVAFGEFVAGFYPGLTAHAQKTGVAVLVFLAALNWVGLRMGSRAQELTSLVKAVGLLALVAACFIVSPKAPVTHLLCFQIHSHCRGPSGVRTVSTSDQ